MATPVADHGGLHGLTAALINLLLVFGAVVHGESLIQGLAWSAVPAILIFSYFSHRERTP